MKRVKQCKIKNESTKYTISGKTDSSSSTIKKTNVLQNLYPLKEQSYKEKNDTLYFPNTMPGQLELLAKDKELCKASSRSIQLSRKYNMSQLTGSEIKYENKLAVVSKMETPISNVMNKSPIVSMPSDTFYNIADTVSTISTSSVSSFSMENKRTFAKIGNREKSISRVISNRLHPTNSEYEINVLHYENDISSENKFSHFATSHLNSTDTNWHLVRNSSSAKIGDSIENANDKQNLLENQQERDMSKTIRDIKYSWETLDSWMLYPQRREYNNLRGQQYLETYSRKPYDCRIKYSWQVIGTSTQTSYSLLQDLLNDSTTEDREPPYKMCSIKYSWQIIGISTQASLHDCNDPDYWSGMLLTPNKNYNKSSSRIGGNERDAKPRNHAKYLEGRLKRCLILNNQQTQTFAEKDVQADVSDYYNAKYSWHNLIKRYLHYERY